MEPEEQKPQTPKNAEEFDFQKLLVVLFELAQKSFTFIFEVLKYVQQKLKNINPVKFAKAYSAFAVVLYAANTIGLIIFLWIVDWIFPYQYPFTATTFLRVPTWSDLVNPIFKYFGFFLVFLVLGYCFRILFYQVFKNTFIGRAFRFGADTFHPKKILHSELIIFNVIGIFEELFFRSIALAAMMRALRLSDWILGGIFFKAGLVQWVTVNIAGPITNWLTLGNFDSVLSQYPDWLAIGAVLAATNAFTKRHKEEGGPLPIIPYFSGLFLGLTAIQYGIVSSIVLSTLYFTVAALLNYHSRLKYLEPVEETS